MYAVDAKSPTPGTSVLMENQNAAWPRYLRRPATSCLRQCDGDPDPPHARWLQRRRGHRHPSRDDGIDVAHRWPTRSAALDAVCMLTCACKFRRSHMARDDAAGTTPFGGSTQTGSIGGFISSASVRRALSDSSNSLKRDARAVFARFESGDSQTGSDDRDLVH